MEPHFFQLLDRIRYQAALTAIAREGKSLALISPVGALAEHYKQALLERLGTDLQHIEIRTFFPADSDGIVQHFNQVVGEMPMAQALANRGDQPGLKLWVVHDAMALPAHELQLLLQLLEKFPGAHVRALLVYGNAEVIPDGLEAFEKSLMRWVVERPNLEQIKECLANEPDPLRIKDLRALIQRMAPGSGMADKALADPAPRSQASASTPDKASSRSAWVLRWLKIFALALGLLILSAGVAAWLNPQLVSKLKSHWLPASPTAAQTQAQSSSTAPDAPATSSTTPPTDQSAASDPANQAAGSSPAQAPKEGESKDPTPTQTGEPSSPTEQSAAQSRTKPEASEPASNNKAAKDGKLASDTGKTGELLTELPEGAAQGEQWAKQLSADNFVVQHSISPTYAQALDIQKRFPELDKAHIVPQFVGNETQARFALVSGPYPGKEDANNFLKTKRSPADSWLRTAASLQERLVAKAARGRKP